MNPVPTYDICIIGSGAMGIALATTLAERGKTIVMLEAGSEEVTEESQNCYLCESSGHPHPGSTGGRFRVYGGSTERWGGQAMRFDAIDFETWPIRYDQVLPYYPQAESSMGLKNPPYESLDKEVDRTAKRLGIKISTNSPSLGNFKFHRSVFTKAPRLRETHSSRLRHPNITRMLETSATKILTNGSGRVVALDCHSSSGEITIYAKQFILGCGGIENARFLLLQKDFYGVPELGGHQKIGCFFQDHPGAHIAEISGPAACLFQSVFKMQDRGDCTSKGRISWSEAARASHDLLAVSGTFLMSRSSSPFEYPVSSENRRINSYDVWQMLKSLARGVIYSPLHYTVLAVSAEDARDSNSRVLLSTTNSDKFNQPRAIMDWHVSPKVSESIIQYLETFEAFIASQNLGKVRRFEIATSREKLHKALTDNSHHIGTTSMGPNQEESVLDSDLKVFGFENFFVVGTSVLPTGSHANPTLTALALAYRLADHLAEKTPT